jgi:hypothetical protein
MRRFAWAVLVLGFVRSAPGALQAQDGPPGEKAALGSNYANGFIPFRLQLDLFGGGQQPMVSMKIFNVLAQVVAVPVVPGSGIRLDKAPLAWNGTGDYTAYWDGKLQGTGREAASGVYVYQMVVQWFEAGRFRSQTFSKRFNLVK